MNAITRPATSSGRTPPRPRRTERTSREWSCLSALGGWSCPPERDRIDHGYYGKFWSARAHVHHVLGTSKSQIMQDKSMRFVRSAGCSACNGTGLQEASLAVTFGGLTIAETNALTFTELVALLRPADAEPLLDVLDRLKGAGNSLFVVEHDLDVMRRADWIVDIGPGAGEGGDTCSIPVRWPVCSTSSGPSPAITSSAVRRRRSQAPWCCLGLRTV